MKADSPSPQVIDLAFIKKPRNLLSFLRESQELQTVYYPTNTIFELFLATDILVLSFLPSKNTGKFRGVFMKAGGHNLGESYPLS